MGTIQRFPASRSLGPDDLEVAASVYVEVVNRLALPAGDDASRERVAQNIIDRMLLGERDPIQLRDEALARLRFRAPDRGGASACARHEAVEEGKREIERSRSLDGIGTGRARF
jgi:hypothetical protein